jgi:hypothetical protein
MSIGKTEIKQLSETKTELNLTNGLGNKVIKLIETEIKSSN